MECLPKRLGAEPDQIRWSQYPLKTQNGRLVVFSAWNHQCVGCCLLTLRFLMWWLCRAGKASSPLGALVSLVGGTFSSEAGNVISSGIDFGRSPPATTCTTL